MTKHFFLFASNGSLRYITNIGKANNPGNSFRGQFRRVAHTVGAGFCSMKTLGVLLQSPLFFEIFRIKSRRE